MRTAVLLGMMLLLAASCRGGVRTTPGQGETPGILIRTGRHLTGQALRLRLDLDRSYAEFRALQREARRTRLRPEARRQWEEAAARTHAGFDAAFARLTALEDGGDWYALWALQRQAEGLALRVEALRTALMTLRR